jgi:hypothetical protein
MASCCNCAPVGLVGHHSGAIGHVRCGPLGQQKCDKYGQARAEEGVQHLLHHKSQESRVAPVSLGSLRAESPKQIQFTRNSFYEYVARPNGYWDWR